MNIFLTVIKFASFGLLFTFLFLIIVFVFINIFIHPSNHRDWSPDQAVLPFADIKNNLVTIYNVRNFTYASTTSYERNYYNKAYDINKLKRIWYVVEPFSGIPGSAHTFLSFEFEGNEFVSISIEIRKEKGETYNPIKGLLNQYELMYVIADEKDAVKLRANYRNDKVYVYPAKTSTANARELFLDMVNEANHLKAVPTFYNTLTKTCTTQIAKHVNKISPKRIPLYDKSVLFPETSDKLAYELGLIDTTLPFEEAREKYYINDRARQFADDPNFSVRIRPSD